MTSGHSGTQEERQEHSKRGYHFHLQYPYVGARKIRSLLKKARFYVYLQVHKIKQIREAPLAASLGLESHRTQVHIIVLSFSRRQASFRVTLTLTQPDGKDKATDLEWPHHSSKDTGI